MLPRVEDTLQLRHDIIRRHAGENRERVNSNCSAHSSISVVDFCLHDVAPLLVLASICVDESDLLEASGGSLYSLLGVLRHSLDQIVQNPRKLEELVRGDARGGVCCVHSCKVFRGL